MHGEFVATALLASIGGETGAEAEDRARLLAAEAALVRIDELTGEPGVPDDTAARMRGRYEFRLRRFEARLDEESSHRERAEAELDQLREASERELADRLAALQAAQQTQAQEAARLGEANAELNERLPA